MPQFRFTKPPTGIIVPQKIATVLRGGLVGLQVLDAASTLFVEKSKEILDRTGLGTAAPNLTEGFQFKQANGFVTFWYKGELWALSDTDGGLINATVLFELGGGCGCGKPPEVPAGEDLSTANK